jgi:hypothetical protein
MIARPAERAFDEFRRQRHAAVKDATKPLIDDVTCWLECAMTGGPDDNNYVAEICGEYSLLPLKRQSGRCPGVSERSRQARPA